MMNEPFLVFGSVIFLGIAAYGLYIGVPLQQPSPEAKELAAKIERSQALHVDKLRVRSDSEGFVLTTGIKSYMRVSNNLGDAYDDMVRITRPADQYVIWNALKARGVVEQKYRPRTLSDVVKP